jgi:energy-converting hydrogenase Eha subunit E
MNMEFYLFAAVAVVIVGIIGVVALPDGLKDKIVKKVNSL